jgi:hypothetical protein
MDDTDYALGRTQAEYQRLTEQAEILRPVARRIESPTLSFVGRMRGRAIWGGPSMPP